MEAHSRALRIAQLHQQRGFRIEHAEEIVEVAGIERDDDLGTVVGDGQFDMRFAILGPVGGQHDLALGKGEIDAAALVAGDDGRLADGCVEGSHGEFDPLRVLAAGEDVAPLGKPPFDQPRVHHHAAALDQHVVLAGRELQHVLFVAQGAIQQLHRPRGHDRRAIARGLVLAHRFGRAFLAGQAAAVGGYRRDVVGRSTPSSTPPKA